MHIFYNVIKRTKNYHKYSNAITNQKKKREEEEKHKRITIKTKLNPIKTMQKKKKHSSGQSVLPSQYNKRNQKTLD